MNKQEIAIFAAGCFWSVQETFDSLSGVISTKVGYIGGKTKNPTYEEVCSDKTGHAEAIEIIFNPEKITYEKLLDIFFSSHDPTQLNRQGPDFGSQYRSAVFYLSLKQKQIAEKKIKQLQSKFNNSIVTSIEKAKEFYPAEEYHQHYNKKNGRSCKLFN